MIVASKRGCIDSPVNVWCEYLRCPCVVALKPNHRWSAWETEDLEHLYLGLRVQKHSGDKNEKLESLHWDDGAVLHCGS